MSAPVTSTSLRERIAALQQRGTSPTPSSPPRSKTPTNPSANTFRDKIARFEKTGGTLPVPKAGTLGLFAPAPTQTSKRNNELYGNRIPSSSQLSRRETDSLTGPPHLDAAARKRRSVSASDALFASRYSQDVEEGGPKEQLRDTSEDSDLIASLSIEERAIPLPTVANIPSTPKKILPPILDVVPPTPLPDKEWTDAIPSPTVAKVPSTPKKILPPILDVVPPTPLPDKEWTDVRGGSPLRSQTPTVIVDRQVETGKREAAIQDDVPEVESPVAEEESVVERQQGLRSSSEDPVSPTQTETAPLESVPEEVEHQPTASEVSVVVGEPPASPKEDITVLPVITPKPSQAELVPSIETTSSDSVGDFILEEQVVILPGKAGPLNDSGIAPDSPLSPSSGSASRPLSTISNAVSEISTASSASRVTPILDSFPTIPVHIPPTIAGPTRSRTISSIRSADRNSMSSTQSSTPSLSYSCASSTNSPTSSSLNAPPSQSSSQAIPRPGVQRSKSHSRPKSYVPMWYDSDSDDGEAGWANVVVTRRYY